MGLKATGCYLSRALSYRGADFALAPVPIDVVFRCATDDPSCALCNLAKSAAAVKGAIVLTEESRQSYSVCDMPTPLG